VQPQPEPYAGAKGNGRTAGILLVEDDAATAKLMSRILSNMGHRVTPAHSVAEALSEAERHPFDLVLSDLGLPDGSGLDVMRQVKKRRPQTKGIAVSGYGMDADVKAAHDAGFERHLLKPVDVQGLKCAIHELIDA